MYKKSLNTLKKAILAVTVLSALLLLFDCSLLGLSLGGSGSTSITALSLDATSATLVIGGTPYQLTAKVTPASSSVTWTTSNAAVASVSATGVVTAVAMGSATITATSGSKTATCAVTSNVIVASGSVQTSASNYSLNLPAYWKNGVLTTLPTGSQAYGEGKNFTYNGTDFYVLGYTYSASNTQTTQIPVYWKNGAMTTLPLAGAAYGTAQQMQFDSSGSMYVQGALYFPASGGYYYTTPGYWKNGTWVDLSMALPSSSTATSGGTNNFSQNGTDFYVTGWLVDPSSGAQVPVYWKNGVVNVVALDSIASASVHGGQVQQIIFPPYATTLLVLIFGNDANWNPIGAYGTSLNGPFTAIPTTGADPNSMVWWAPVSPSGDIYATGVIGPSSTNFWGLTKTVYWKNWQEVTLPALPPGQPYGMTGGSSFAGNDVYISGTTNSVTGRNPRSIGKMELSPCFPFLAAVQPILADPTTV